MEGSKNSNKNRSNNLSSLDNDKPPYSFEVDFWSLGRVIFYYLILSFFILSCLILSFFILFTPGVTGCVLFELLTGNTPFYAESLIETYSKIINFAHSFEFPENDKISDNAKDLIKNLICDQKTRFKNLEQFQQ